MNAPPPANVHGKIRHVLTGDPHQDMCVSLDLADHEMDFYERAFADGRSVGAMNALKALQNYIAGALTECVKLGAAV